MQIERLAREARERPTRWGPCARMTGKQDSCDDATERKISTTLMATRRVVDDKVVGDVIGCCRDGSKVKTKEEKEEKGGGTLQTWKSRQGRDGGALVRSTTCREEKEGE